MSFNLRLAGSLVYAIEDISDDTFSATWYSGIEFMLWAIIQGDIPAINLYATIQQEYLDELKYLSNELQGWIIWSDEEESPHVISLNEWSWRYIHWLAEYMRVEASLTAEESK